MVGAAVLAGTVGAVAFGVLATVRVHLLEDNSVRTALRTRLELVRPEVHADGTLGADAPSATRTSLVQVVGPDGTVRSATGELAGLPALLSPERTQRAGPAGVQSTVTLQHPDIDLAVLSVPVQLAAAGQSPAGTGEIVVGLDAEGFLTARHHLTELLIIGLVGAVLALAQVTWVLAGRALRTVTRITAEAEAVGAHDVGRGLPVPEGDAELTGLVAALNRLLGRLQQTYLRDTAFASGASHRLRTPLATMRAEAELALIEGDAAAMRAALERVVSDADHMAAVLDRMLTMVTPASPATSAVLSDAVNQLAENWHRHAGTAGVDLRLTAEGDATVNGQELAAVLDPLVENAVHHTPVGGLVNVTLAAGSAELHVEVLNTGNGVPTHLRNQLFDPWVSSRPATTAGGLGLWLAREVARASGGDVWLDDGAAGNTIFRARLPVRAPTRSDCQPERPSS